MIQLDEDIVYDEYNLVDGMEVQLPEDEQFNDYGKASDVLIQLGFLDLSVQEELEWVDLEDPNDNAEVEPLIQEVALGDEDVPFEWRYWEHTETTVPPVDESGAPPLESGWVDPDTNEEIP